MLKWISSLVAALLLAVFALLALAGPATDPFLEFAKMAMNLTVAVLITGVLSDILARRTARRAELEDRKVVLAGALRNLKAGYEQVQLARFFLSTNRTAASFIEQIPRLTEARASLHLVQRERYLIDTEIDDRVQEMLNYMRDLADEYRENYPGLAAAALREERARRQFIEGAVDTPPEPPTLSDTQFPKLAEFGLPPEQWNQEAFSENYQMAKTKLQNWLTESLAHRPEVARRSVARRGETT